MWETIRYDVDGHVATITLDRPEKLNAFNTKMAEELWAVFDETDGDDNVRAIIVTGEGPGFCAGADLEAGEKSFDYASIGASGPVRDDGSL